VRINISRDFHPFLSPVFGYPLDFSRLLGGIVRNSSGHIISASSSLVIWVGAVDPSRGGLVDEGGTGLELDLADKAILDWESQAIDLLINKEGQKGDLEIFANFGRR